MHAVKPGAVYRSAQLDAKQLADAIRTDGIKTVLNLRGDNTGTPWYDEEMRTSA